MGNRAVIAFGKSKTALGIYLHWNGGHESVKAFLDAAKRLKAVGDEHCGPARLIQIIGNFYGGTNSLGIGPVGTLDNANQDNGTFYVDPATMEITSRAHVPASAASQPFDQAYYDVVLAEVLAHNAEPFARR